MLLPYTALRFEESRYGSGYTISEVSATKGVSVAWTPNSTLLMGGDTSFLLYDVGAVLMREPSRDPIFATGDALLSDPEMPLFLSADVAVPIICDTKYILCSGREECSPLDGVKALIDWASTHRTRAARRTWSDITKLMAAALARPPINLAAWGSSAVIASETIVGSGPQLIPHNVTARRELTRLVEASMFMLASYMQLSAAGYWDVGDGVQGFGEPNNRDPLSLCNNVILESSSANTLPVVPYVLVLVSLILVGLMGRMNSLLPRRVLSASQRDFHDVFMLYSAGQLHREVVERIRGYFVNVDTTDEYPTVDTFHSGPAVVRIQGKKRFGADDSVDMDDSEQQHSYPMT